MSFLSNLFGNNHKSNANEGEHLQVEASDLSSFGNLFVNPEPPGETESKEHTEKVALDEFLSRDYYRMGFEEGYKTHTSEAKSARINVIKAEFRLIISRKIDQLRQEMLTLEDHLIDVEGMDERLDRKLRRRMEYMQERCSEYENEKALSVEDEGIVMESIHKFNDGFVRGTQMYMEEKLLASSTGLFD